MSDKPAGVNMPELDALYHTCKDSWEVLRVLRGVVDGRMYPAWRDANLDLIETHVRFCKTWIAKEQADGTIEVREDFGDLLSTALGWYVVRRHRELLAATIEWRLVI